MSSVNGTAHALSHDAPEEWLAGKTWRAVVPHTQKNRGQGMPLLKLLAIPLGCQRTTTKWLVMLVLQLPLFVRVSAEPALSLPKNLNPS